MLFLVLIILVKLLNILSFVAGVALYMAGGKAEIHTKMAGFRGSHEVNHAINVNNDTVFLGRK